MGLELFITFVVKVMLIAFKPGPGALVHAAVALRDGQRPALIMAAGTETGHAIIFTLIFFFYQAYATGLSQILHWASILAGICFIALAGRALFRGQLLKQSGTNKALVSSSHYLSGLVWAFINPVNIAFYVGVMAPHLAAGETDFATYLLLVTCLVIIMFLQHILYISVPVAMRDNIQSDKGQRTVRYASFVVFLVLGLWFLFEGTFSSRAMT
ncbi:MAG: LysE family transporter [Pseudomonadota bacterium]